MKKPSYIRDGRAPVPKSEAVSRIMSANRAKDTKPELSLRKELWSSRIRGYRLHWKKAPGRPDIAFPSKKVAVFVNGCYWHRCPSCHPHVPKTNTKFWKDKFRSNMARDERKKYELLLAGWSVIIIWECEIKKDIKACVDRIKNAVAK